MFIYVIALPTSNGYNLATLDGETLEFATMRDALNYAHRSRFVEFKIMREVYSVRANEWVVEDD